MAYGAVSRIDPMLPWRVLGTGETYADAKEAAAAWLEE